MAFGDCEDNVLNLFWDSLTSHFRLLATHKYMGMLLVHNIARPPQGRLLRCLKTTMSESLIGQRVVLNKHVWDEVERWRGPQRDVAHMEADGNNCWN